MKDVFSFIPIAAAVIQTRNTRSKNNSPKLQPKWYFDHGRRQEECIVKCGSCLRHRNPVAYPSVEENVDVGNSSIKAFAGSEPTTGPENAGPNTS